MSKLIAQNKKASHDYFLDEFYEAGIVLVGTEIKSLRKSGAQLKESYISFVDNEAYIKEMFIAKYAFGNLFNHDETRIRKLLLHKAEIKKLQQKVKLKGYTVVPVSLYFDKGRAKLKIALARGKSLYDKRNSEKEKTAKREMERLTKNYYG